MVDISKITVACFGEVLWDLFPGQQRRAGGAPFNVAYNLSRMGIDARMISAVGNDELGRALLAQIKDWKMSIDTVRVSTAYHTSTVVATFDTNNEAHYEITEEVAWDYIEVDNDMRQLANDADALVFGSLASRSSTSKDTLFSLLESSNYNVFDINLRKPYYNIKTIKDLLHRSHVAKFNKAELLLLLESLSKPYTTEEEGIAFLQDSFDIAEIIISKGSKGAIYASKTGSRFYPAIPIEVADTVGSGDAFLAGFLSCRLTGQHTGEQIMEQAIALGAYITSQKGACPTYSIKDFLSFKNSNKPAKTLLL